MAKYVVPVGRWPVCRGSGAVVIWMETTVGSGCVVIAVRLCCFQVCTVSCFSFSVSDWSNLMNLPILSIWRACMCTRMNDMFIYGACDHKIVSQMERNLPRPTTNDIKHTNKGNKKHSMTKYSHYEDTTALLEQHRATPTQHWLWYLICTHRIVRLSNL